MTKESVKFPMYIYFLANVMATGPARDLGGMGGCVARVRARLARPVAI